jgi:hypothetical protein
MPTYVDSSRPSSHCSLNSNHFNCQHLKAVNRFRIIHTCRRTRKPIKGFCSAACTIHYLDVERDVLGKETEVLFCTVGRTSSSTSIELRGVEEAEDDVDVVVCDALCGKRFRDDLNHAEGDMKDCMMVERSLQSMNRTTLRLPNEKLDKYFLCAASLCSHNE